MRANGSDSTFPWPVVSRLRSRDPRRRCQSQAIVLFGPAMSRSSCCRSDLSIQRSPTRCSTWRYGDRVDTCTLLEILLGFLRQLDVSFLASTDDESLGSFVEDVLGHCQRHGMGIAAFLPGQFLPSLLCLASQANDNVSLILLNTMRHAHLFSCLRRAGAAGLVRSPRQATRPVAEGRRSARATSCPTHLR